MAIKKTISTVNEGFYYNSEKNKIDLPLDDIKNIQEYIYPKSISGFKNYSKLSDSTNSTSSNDNSNENNNNSNSIKTKIFVVANDILDQCIKMKEELNYENPSCLDLASKFHPGGRYKKGAPAQEEDMCRRTDIWRYLESKRDKYPWDQSSNNTNGPNAFYIPKAVYFRSTYQNSYSFLDKPR